VLTVGQTQHYFASEFDGFSGSGADCNANGQPDDCECLGDMDLDGVITLADLSILLSAFGTCTGEPNYNPAADFDASGCVDLADLSCFLNRFGTTCP